MTDVSGIPPTGIFAPPLGISPGLQFAQNSTAQTNQFFQDQAALNAQSQNTFDGIMNNLATQGPASSYGKVGGYPSFGDPAAPGTYSPGSGRSSFSGAPLYAGGQSVFDTGVNQSYNPYAPFGGGYPGASSTMGTSFGNFNTSGYYNANPDALAEFRSGGWGTSDPTQFAQTHFQAAHDAEGGWRSGWEPFENTNFNTKGYYDANPDAWAAFDASGSYDPTAFAQQHLRDAHNNPLENGNWRTGWGALNSGFDTEGYFKTNKDAADWFGSGTSGYTDPTAFAQYHLGAAHDAEGGWRTGWNPSNSGFNTEGYFKANPDAADWFGSGTSGYTDPNKFAEFHLGAAHAAEGGMRGGWQTPNAGFDTAGYFAQNPDALDWFSKGTSGYADPTEFAQFHLGEANKAEGGNWRGGWQLASNDPNDLGGMAWTPEGWTSPYGGKGGISPTGEIANNPYAPPPGADLSNPASYWYSSPEQKNVWELTREPYTMELANDPARMYDMAVRLSLELSNRQDTQGRQAIAEAMLNKFATQTPEPWLADPLSKEYYPKDADYLAKYAKATQELKNDPNFLAQIYGEIGLAARGSNLSNGATDWASGSVADNSARYATETWKSPIEGERFFRKDLSNSRTGAGVAQKVQDWYRSMLNGVPY